MMNGCDHQPLQKDITEAIRVARKLYPDMEFIHSDFKTYVKAMEKEISENFSTVKGELTSQETDGRWTLANTASSWMGLKVDNRAGENSTGAESRTGGSHGRGAWQSIPGRPDDLQLEKADAESSA